MEDKKQCSKCGVLVSKFAYFRHERSCKGDAKLFRGNKSEKECYKTEFTGKCKFCNKDCKNYNSQNNHERCCKNNPSRQITNFEKLDFQQKGFKRSNQYLRAKELGLEPPIISQSTKDKLRQAMFKRSKEWLLENNKKISKTCLEKSKRGEWHISLAQKMHYNYKGIDLHGSWELAYAQYLDNLGILWKRPKDRFVYEFEGKLRYYIPDFYLISTEEFVEIKGFEIEKDRAKWNQFPGKLIVLKEKDLIELGIDIKV